MSDRSPSPHHDGHTAAETRGSQQGDPSPGVRTAGSTGGRDGTPEPTASTAGWGRALGMASVGLGVPLVAAPGLVADAIGIPRSRAAHTALVAVGARELAVAAGLLTRPRPWMLWARVAGDAMDLTLLGNSLAQGVSGGRRAARIVRTAATTAVVAGIAVADLIAALTRSGRSSEVEATGTVTIRRSPGDVYAFWRRLETLPTFMAHVEQVRPGPGRSVHWVVSGPFGRSVEWDAEITEDLPATRIAWRSTGGSVPNDGVVRFVDAPGGRGTEVHVTLRYRPPAGELGMAVARYFGEEPHQQLDDDLRRLKQILETGAIVRSDGAPDGKRARREFPQHPARPLSQRELEEMLS